MTPTNQSIRRNELCGEFWLDLKEALGKVGGDPSLIEACMDVPLHEFVELVAPNGIRPVFKEAGHILYKELPPEGE